MTSTLTPASITADPRATVDSLDGATAAHVRDTLLRVENQLNEVVTTPGNDWLTAAARYLITAGGKRLRPLIVILAGGAAGAADRERIVDAAVCVELVHVATLHHDDVMDDAWLRHGVPSVNRKWGNRLAVLVGDHLMAASYEPVRRLGIDQVGFQSRTLNRLIRGQYLESLPLADSDDPVARYLAVASGKSAALFGWAAWAGGHCAGAGPETVRALQAYGEALGMAFQISDDVLDVVGDPLASGKQPGADLRAGVRSLPVVRALARRDAVGHRFRELAGAGPVADEERVREALDLLRGSVALEETYADLSGYAVAADEALRELPESPARDGLRRLIDFVVRRTA